MHPTDRNILKFTVVIALLIGVSYASFRPATVPSSADVASVDVVTEVRD